MTTHPGALRHWFVPVASIAAAMIALLVFLGMAGVLPPQPLEETRIVLSLKWGLIVAFILQLGFVWRDHRKYSVTAASAVLARARGAVMLGNVTAALAMLAGLYVITKSAWYLLAIAAYAAFSAWIFRPIDPVQNK